MRSRAGSARAACLATRDWNTSADSVFIDSILTELIYCVKLGAMTTNQPPLWRRAVAELFGTSLLVMIVVGSGIAAQTLSPGDVGLQLLENSTATVLGLTVLILLFGPVSGAHLNPVVSLADWFVGRRGRTGLSLAEVGGYAAAQVVGA